MLWNLIVTVLTGALAGWLAGQFMHTRGGFWFNAALGIVGGGVGAFLGRLIGITASRVSIGGVLLSAVGACVVIWLVRVIGGKKG